MHRFGRFTGGIVQSLCLFRQAPGTTLGPRWRRRRLGILSRHGLGPAVVGFADRRAHDLRYPNERFGQFVPCDVLPAGIEKFLIAGCSTFCQLNDSNDFGSPAWGRPPDHCHVVDIRMRRYRALDLLGENLLATGVYGD